MSIVDTTRKALTEIPVSDILRERLSLALDYASDSERKVSDLQTQVGKLQATLEAVQVRCGDQSDEIERLKKQLEEDVFISHGVEFRLPPCYPS